MSDCIFCKIVAGEIPCFKLYEDEHVMSFLDINPAYEGHCLIIPKKHAQDIRDLDADGAAHILTAAQEIAKAMDKTLKPDGYNLVQNNGKVAGQEVMHFHMHLVPRYKSCGKSGSVKQALHPEGYEYKASMDELKELAGKISQELN
jgi:histidine triad (HIT) family protein